MSGSLRLYLRRQIDLYSRARLSEPFVAFCDVCDESFDVMPQGSHAGRPVTNCGRCRSNGWRRQTARLQVAGA